jgi:hypothetical protein
MGTAHPVLEFANFKLDPTSSNCVYESYDRMRVEQLFAGAPIAKTTQAIAEIVFGSMGTFTHFAHRLTTHQVRSIRNC